MRDKQVRVILFPPVRGRSERKSKVFEKKIECLPPVVPEQIMHNQKPHLFSSAFVRQPSPCKIITYSIEPPY